jgi:hypothetical protein
MSDAPLKRTKRLLEEVGSSQEHPGERRQRGTARTGANRGFERRHRIRVRLELLDRLDVS